MKELCAVLLAGCALSATADSITLQNHDQTPIYMAVNQSTFDSTEGWAANSVAGWIHQGQKAVLTSSDSFLTNMGIEPRQDYAVGYFDGQHYGLCGIVTSGSNHTFAFRNGECHKVLEHDTIQMTNTSQGSVYITIQGGDQYTGDTINTDAGWIQAGQTYSFDATDGWLKTMGIKPGDTYALGFQDANNNQFQCATNVVSGTQRHFELNDDTCVEVHQKRARTLAQQTIDPGRCISKENVWYWYCVLGDCGELVNYTNHCHTPALFEYIEYISYNRFIRHRYTIGWNQSHEVDLFSIDRKTFKHTMQWNTADISPIEVNAIPSPEAPHFSITVDQEQIVSFTKHMFGPRHAYELTPDVIKGKYDLKIITPTGQIEVVELSTVSKVATQHLENVSHSFTYDLFFNSSITTPESEIQIQLVPKQWNHYNWIE